MRIIAHRGASAAELENTVEAFELARSLGADGVELDVRICRSGEVVVFHDADLSRLAGRPGDIEELTLEELRSVQLKGGRRIPTLEEAFEACGPELWVNVELKVDRLRPTGLEPAVAQCIRRTGVGERVECSSFQPLALWRLRRAAPSVGRALLFGTEQAPIWRSGAQGRGLGLVAMHPEHRLASRGRIAGWHRAGLLVRVWTVDDPHRIRELATMGVDAVISNAPDRARDALMGIA